MKVSTNIYECTPMFCDDVPDVDGNFHAPQNTSAVLSVSSDTAVKNGTVTLKLSFES